MDFGGVAVARKPPRKGPGEKSPRKPPDDEPRQVLLSIKGRLAWKEWLDRLAAFDRSSTVQLIDRAVARYAKDVGFNEPPPER
jgi:hypothetical protein